MAIVSQLIKVVVQNENSRRKYAPMHKCTNLTPLTLKMPRTLKNNFVNQCLDIIMGSVLPISCLIFVVRYS